MTENKERETKWIVKYHILIKDGGAIYQLGSIKINKNNGDIYFYPAFDFNIVLHDNDYSELRKVDHLSFHKSGEFHIKVKKGQGKQRLSKITGCIIELGKDFSYGENSNDIMARRTAIKDIKFQDMFQLFIKDYKKLKLYEENIYEIDLLFDIEKIKKNRLVFKFSIISGIIIVNSLKNTEQESKLKIKSVACDVNIQRCLGYESGNADKLLQYSISSFDKEEFDGNINLRLFYDNPINKIEI